jgi:hypothetical protein
VDPGHLREEVFIGAALSRKEVKQNPNRGHLCIPGNLAATRFRNTIRSGILNPKRPPKKLPGQPKFPVLHPTKYPALLVNRKTGFFLILGRTGARRNPTTVPKVRISGQIA